MTFHHFAEPKLHIIEKDLNSQVVHLPSAAKYLVSSYGPCEHSHIQELLGKGPPFPYSASLTNLKFFLEFGQWASLLSPGSYHFGGTSMYTHEDIY